jgi:hypothetical protein
VLATTISGVGRAGPEVARDAPGGTRRLESNSTEEWLARQVLLSSTAMSVGQGAKCGFQLGVDRVALAQDPWQAEQG